MDDIELDPVVEFKPAPVLVQPKIEKNVSNDQSNTIDNTATINNTETKPITNELNNEEIEEMKDSFNTTTSNNYDNKAFELEDIEIEAKTNPFARQDRPGSMMSIKSNASTSSRSSVNCTSGRVRCPNLRLKRFYSYNPDVGFSKVSEELKALILPEKDGQFIGNWLLIEISIWDFHREKIALLTEKTLIIVTYNFIKSRIENYNRIELSNLKKVIHGNLKYPKKSMMGQYEYGAIKLCWDDDKLPFLKKWNPFTDKVPFLILTSHHILYNEKEKETAIYNCDEFINSLEFAISKLPEGQNIEIREEEIEIENYANFISVLYNQNWLGFQLDRNGVSF